MDWDFCESKVLILFIYVIYMKKVLSVILLAVSIGIDSVAQVFEPVPYSWKWLNNDEVAFSYNGTYTGDQDFSILPNKKFKTSLKKAPEKYVGFPIRPQGAVNLTYSPDSTMLAFTRNNNLFVVNIESGKETQVTTDGTDLILNGYASWVYYEEIFGRPSRYRAFWWSPDSKKIGFYRFDNTRVPMFPIYSPKGQDGSLRLTRYPKCGENNPEVRIGIADVATNKITWADFNSKEDQYFGTPFWGADSKEFFVSRMPRVQNTLDLYAVSVTDGAKKHIYHETYKTWLDWITGMVFGEKGLYMARSFETGWSQIYYLSYDGKDFRRLTEGPNWRVNILRVDEKKGDVFYTAERDSRVRQALYKVDKKGKITALTDTAMNVSKVKFSPDGKKFVASLSNYITPPQVWLYDTKGSKKPYKVADAKGKEYAEDLYVHPQPLKFTNKDGLLMEGNIVYPKNFDPTKKYPVHVSIYGGPDSPVVNDRYQYPNSNNQWWSSMGIIQVSADCRAAGHNGRQGTDYIYRQLDVIEVEDFVEWANFLKSLPYVNGDKIGVEGFSFGGTMTSLLLMNHSDAYHYGIAGGGVYDWALYDSHYTERYMDTPQHNPEGYAKSRAINSAKNYPVKYATSSKNMKEYKSKEDLFDKMEKVEPVMLKITHGTGDDNVHFQNTLQLIDALHKEGAKFEFMIYPDGMHGYGGYQGEHFGSDNREFWVKYLLEK